MKHWKAESGLGTKLVVCFIVMGPNTQLFTKCLYSIHSQHSFCWIWHDFISLGLIGFLRNPARKRIALVLVVYVVVGSLFIPFICQWLPYSWYYFPDSGQDYKVIIAENNKRLVAANNFLSSLNRTLVQNTLSSPRRTFRAPDFCFVINSVSRPVATSYLTQVVSSLLPQVLDDERTILAVNNAEGPTHKEAMLLSNIIQVISNKRDRNIPHSNFDKARLDYLFSLKWCSRKNATFTVVFEDDALPSKDFISRLRFVLKNRIDTNKKNWAILKLFYPEKYQGWGNEFHLVAELLGLSVTGGVIFTVAFYCNVRLVGGAKQFSCFLFMCSTLFTMYLFLSIGRPHWIAVRKFSVHLSSVVTAPGCCIPATLFPCTHLDGLIDYLEGIKCNQLFPIDLALDEFADHKELQKLLVVPNLVKHIGYVSSLPGKGWKNSKEFRVKWNNIT